MQRLFKIGRGSTSAKGFFILIPVMGNKILVVGGYGEVGKHVVYTLLALGHEVVVGGRNAAKALAFFGELYGEMDVGSRASFRKVDVAEI